jgi:putative hydrolase
MTALANSQKVNQQIAIKLREMANILEQQNAQSFRITAYRRAAQTIENLNQDLYILLQNGGTDALRELPNIGQGIASAVEEILRTGKWGRLERLIGQVDPVKLFQIIPGVGPELAKLIHDELDIDTLEALEQSAHDGSLEKLKGIGPRRVASICASLDSILKRVRNRPRTNVRLNDPDISLLLDVDREYRKNAAENKLPVIAPKRFNPRGEAWLPILHTERNGHHFTALFSNTARAHELGRTNDWVVVYFYDDDHHEGQYTIVTEKRGKLTGRRVIRGREVECQNYYKNLDQNEPIR